MTTAAGNTVVQPSGTLSSVLVVVRRWLPTVLIGGIAIGAWEGLVAVNDVPSWKLPPPSGIAVEMWEARSLLASHTWVTLQEVLVGFAIALGAGVCEGLSLGDNAKAGFITRGLAEIARLSVAAGANPLTLSGLSGMGDLIATCASPLSRNHQFGVQLSKGRTLEEIRAPMKSVAEGVDTTAAAVALADRMGVEMPIAQATHRVLFERAKVTEVIAELLGRAPRPELGDLEP